MTTQSRPESRDNPVCGYVGCRMVEWHEHDGYATQSRPESVGPTDGRLPCLILVAGSLAPGCLLPGTDYRVVEIREHWEPEKDGERAVSTVIRFDPLRATNHQPVALREAAQRVVDLLHDGLLGTLGFYAGPNARTAVDSRTAAKVTALGEAARDLRAALVAADKPPIGMFAALQRIRDAANGDIGNSTLSLIFDIASEALAADKDSQPARDGLDAVLASIPNDGLPDRIGDHYRVVTVCGHCGEVWSRVAAPSPAPLERPE